MENLNPFFDLGLSDKCVETQQFQNAAKKLLEYGYKTVAINRFLDEKSMDSRKGLLGKKKNSDSKITDPVPEPVSLTNLLGCENLKILNRLTVIFSEGTTIHKVVRSENFKKYDIFAVLPTNQKALQFACSEVDADIISFDPEIRTAIKFNRKQYNLAVERGMYFEIMYSPAICSTALRKNIITMSHLYHAFGKSKNIIMTSWATNPILIRGPYDATILGLIFGLTEEKCKNAISYNCKRLLLRAEGRKLGKVVMLVNTNEVIESMVISDTEEESDMELDLSDQPVAKKSKPDN